MYLALQNHLLALFSLSRICDVILSIICSFTFSKKLMKFENSMITLAIAWSLVINFLLLLSAFLFTCPAEWDCFAKNVQDCFLILTQHIDLLMLQIHPLIFSIWHTFNFNHPTKNIVKDFIPRNSCWRCHMGLSLVFFLLLIFLGHPQPLVPYLIPLHPLCIIGNSTLIFFVNSIQFFSLKGLWSYSQVFFFTHVCKEFCVVCSLSIKFPCSSRSSLSTNSWVTLNPKPRSLNLQWAPWTH